MKFIIPSLLLLVLVGCKDSETKTNTTRQIPAVENATQKTTQNQKNLGAIGLEYAQTTQQVLGKQLIGTIQKKGTLEALRFCSIQAYPITDSMALKHKATIKRVSDRPRNKANKANAAELEYIKSFKQDIVNGITPIPLVKENRDDTVEFYYPIITNAMCLQCHGTEKEVNPETLTVIRSLYPQDMALGYGTNEVRGIWSINFKEQ
ncbi:DUF3365 domain-containing protein [Cellulophaga sp. HaHa_2_1]|uniref:Tll0287-like domain-containing protein n=1 Tax=Cellulophaga sp. HaHa_2_1 TaxID=2749994 RepID=UPI001C4EF508|nr:DUF3365 domain-containing protein [Cellulophaga sp. HaHa_2_1]QXP53407.1 DUF3365 domain-containing protein [Cellulophaga sp. HaHa_2_1]